MIYNMYSIIQHNPYNPELYLQYIYKYIYIYTFRASYTRTITYVQFKWLFYTQVLRKSLYHSDPDLVV